MDRGQVEVGVGAKVPLARRVVVLARDGVRPHAVAGVVEVAVFACGRLGRDQDAPVVGGVAEALPVLAEGVLATVVDGYEDAAFVSHVALVSLGGMLVVVVYVSCGWNTL